MTKRALIAGCAVVVAVVVLTGGRLSAQAIAVPLGVDSSGLRILVAIDGRIVEIIDPDGGVADFDDPAGTGWLEVVDPATTGAGVADLLLGPDGNIYFSRPSAGAVGRLPLPPLGTASNEAPDLVQCGDCEPSKLGVNFSGDLLATDLHSGGLLRWSALSALCSDGVSPAGFCFAFGSPSLPIGSLVPGSASVGPFLALQEWYTGKLLSVWGSETSGPKNQRKGPTLRTSEDPEYVAHTLRAELEASPADLAISRATISYATGSKLNLVDLVGGASSDCVQFSGQGNPQPRFLAGDVGGLVHVATASSKQIEVWRVDTTACSAPIKLKTFPTSTFGRNLEGIATTFSALTAQIAGSGSETTYELLPDGMHKYRLTTVCDPGTECEVRVKPVDLETALNAIETSEDPNNPGLANASIGLPFVLPGHARPFEYHVIGVAAEELHEFSTAVEGTNFRLACCQLPCSPTGCDDPVGNADTCEFGVAIYSLPIPSHIVPDPRGTQIGGTACYEGLISTDPTNAGLYAAEFCGWRSPAVATPPSFDPDEFFCGNAGVATVVSGGTFPTKFEVGPAGQPCTTSEELPVDLNILFSAGVFGSCVDGTFVPLAEVQPILGIEPNGEGYIDPVTGQVKFAKAGPKKLYQFNFDSAQVPLVTGSSSLPTLVMINATFLEDSIEEGDQNIFLRVEP
jgi:hypothetical protein